MLPILLFGSLAAAAVAPFKITTRNHVETFEHNGNGCSNDYYHCGDLLPGPGPYNNISWNNITSWFQQNINPGRLLLQPYDDDYWYGMFNSPIKKSPLSQMGQQQGEDGLGGSGPANMSSIYRGSCVDFFNLHSFAWGCGANQNISSYDLTWGANCTINIDGYFKGFKIASVKSTYTEHTQFSGVQYWFMNQTILPAYFQALPLDTVVFTAHAAPGTKYLSDISVGIDVVNYTTTSHC